MNIERQQLHELVDIVDLSEFGVIYHLLSKFVYEDNATEDEHIAIKAGREDFARGEYTNFDDVNWN
jgi:hypothetical protein